MTGMKLTLMGTMVLAAGVLIGVGASGQDSPTAPAMGDGIPSPEAMVEMMKEMSAPVMEHERLGALVGTWDQKGVFNMGPGTEPIEMSSTVENRWILGKRFVESVSTGTFMETPMESRLTYGFDSRPGFGDYYMIGIDTMGTYYVAPRGSYDPATNSFTFAGEEFDPMSGQKMKYRFVVTIESKDKHTWKWIMQIPGMDEFEAMRAEVTRRK
ncbi:MAG: DUF1579 family protein [Phycisphaerales bacterium]|nr:DUF1579 family protein [Phycisphaerales bacterium]